jgi:hypothetical protein
LLDPRRREEGGSGFGHDGGGDALRAADPGGGDGMGAGGGVSDCALPGAGLFLAERGAPDSGVERAVRDSVRERADRGSGAEPGDGSSRDRRGSRSVGSSASVCRDPDSGGVGAGSSSRV